MTWADEALIRQALEAMNCDDVKELKSGGQKDVRIVRQGEQLRVLKLIALNGATDEALKRAEREVSLLVSLKSENVVRVTDSMVELGNPTRGAAWLEEYLDGADLGDLLGSPWSWDETADMAKQVAAGLGSAHAQGVVHRDLSPNNIRRTSSGRYKVMDFGFARFTLRSGLTVAGQPGTPGHMSPEHLNSYSGGPNPSSDVFMLGILMYCCLAGTHPIPYLGDDADYVKRLQSVHFQPLDAQRGDLGPERIGFVHRCLHAQPARRFLNGERARIALEGLPT